MLLKLEVDGFKNLLGFQAEFGPFTCITGENGVGKSNVFDAIEFLALSADLPLLEASRSVRSDHAELAGESSHLFTVGSAGSMRFAVEAIVPREVTDDFGAPAKPAITLLRYELEVAHEAPSGALRQGRLVVAREGLRHINVGEAHQHVRFPHRAEQFRRQVVTGRRAGGAFISTEAERITVHQDGGSRGRPRRALPVRAGTTVVSTVNTADDPTILALRRELQSWRRLALEPSALRSADSFTDPSRLGTDGRHLAAALHRIAHQPGVEPGDVYARVANRLSRLAGLDVRALRIDVDEVRERLDVVVRDGSRGELPARSLSEGTLRFLALCVILEDPTMTGLITMEEPENGIHPANLPEMLRLVRDLAVDPEEAPASDNPLRQIIVNTHSPNVVQLVEPADLLHASERPVRWHGGSAPAIRLDGLRGTWRVEDGAGVTTADFLPYLEQPHGAQLALALDVA